MKKSILLLAAISITAFTSCKEKTETKTEKTVVIEKNADEQPEQVADSAATPDGTNISVNKNGVEISSKDGLKSTSVQVDKDGAAISTKK